MSVQIEHTATKAWQLVNFCRKSVDAYRTPVQNNLKELYNLITLLKPGQLGSYRTLSEIHARFYPKTHPAAPTAVGSLIRNRRGEGTVQFTKRHVYPIVVELTPPERAFTSDHRIDQGIKLAPFKANILPLITLQREVCSSFYAAGVTLQKIYDKYGLDPDAKIMDVMNEAVKIRQNSKCDIIEKVVSQIRDRVIIFTEYKASQEYIRYRLEKAIPHFRFRWELGE